MNIPCVISTVVNYDLCIGCGLCVYKCPKNALEMKWNKFGFLIPKLTGNCDSDGSCISVCPFNPFPKKEVKTENEISEIFLMSTKKYHSKIGKYIGIYAGFAKEFRLSSSSGGIATYILTELLERGIVDYIFAVKESHKSGVYYEYSVISSKEELLKASKTKYFPVTLGTVMPKIQELNGKVAIVGVACFIKAIRLAQHYEPKLKEKINFLVGIICGGLKSRFFTEYLADKAGVKSDNILKPQYRIKDIKSSASDYSFGCLSKADQKEYTIRMKNVGDMWGTGMFKANACDFCDDVTAELADISLGDAWIHPYNQDGKGNSLIITRSSLAEDIINRGINKKDIIIDTLTIEDFLMSQKGAFNHRQKGLSFRLKRAKKNEIPISSKRFEKENNNIEFKLVQYLRMKIRQKSLKIWENTPDSNIFDIKISKLLLQLKIATKIYHLINSYNKYFEKY
jgi:coenzyme F420-reducing hydrogenase beta subunit